MATARRSSISPARSKAACCRGPALRSRCPRRIPSSRSSRSLRTSLKLLLEAMPAAIGIARARRLIHANAAFAYAFGYRSLAELIEAGGLEAILPTAIAALVKRNGAERSAPVDALTRSRRKLKVAFGLSLLDRRRRLEALRLIDQTSARRGERRVADGKAPHPQTRSRQPGRDALAARRLDFLAKVSHEVRTPLNSILGFTELMLAGALRPDRQRPLHGLCRGHPSERPLRAVAAQRPARHLQDRGRQVRARLHRGRGAGARRGLRQQPAAARQARRASCSAPRSPRSCRRRRRSATAEADPAQPAHQRHQVHQGRADR